MLIKGLVFPLLEAKFIDNNIFAMQIRAHAVQLKPLLMNTVSRLFLSTFQQLSQRFKKSSLSRTVLFLRGLPAIFFNSKTKFSHSHISLLFVRTLCS